MTLPDKTMCGEMLPLLRVNRDEATRFAVCRLPAGHDGWHNENEGLHPVSWIDNPEGTIATGVAAEYRERLRALIEGRA
jgi:hypothetical protein